MTIIQVEPVLTAAREAAWNGSHAQAIAICSDALSSAQLDAAERLSFYDTRAESSIAQGQLDLAAEDAAAMGEIAETSNQPSFLAQALNRLALVQMRIGDLETAVSTAAAALEAAKGSGQDALQAESLFRLAEAQSRVGDAEGGITAANQAIELYQRLEDPVGEGRAFWALSLAYFKLSRNEETERVLQRALTLCRQAGDLYGLGNVLNVLTFVEPDISKNLKRLKEARQAFESAGYLERQLTCTGNLSGNYGALGLQRRADRLLDEAVEISQQIGARLLYAYNLGGRVEAAVIAGDAAAALRYSLELEEIAPSIGDPLVKIQIPGDRGRIALLEQDYPMAITYFEQAEKVAGEAGVLTSEVGALSHLSEAYLAIGDPPAAVAATTRATALHRAQGLGVLDGFASQEIWWRHSQALSANGQREEAYAALEMAYQFLVDGIASLSDEGLRRNYLNKIQVNREIIAAWLGASENQNLPAEERFAHLAGEANLSEPFQRLVDSGLRLNELRTANELHEFLIDEATELSGAERVLLILETDSGRALAGSQLPRGEDAAALIRAIDGYLDQTRRARTVQLTTPADSAAGSRSCVAAPLVAQNKVLGYLYADLSAPFGVLGEPDRDMLGLLASQAAVALDNARWSEGLELEVAQRTAELNARVDELAILNSLGEAMAQTLDVQTVTRIVGDKVRDIFKAEVVGIILLDARANMLHSAYSYDAGLGGYVHNIKPFTLGEGLTSRVIASRKPLNLGTGAEADALGSLSVVNNPKTWSENETESYLGVPILVSDKVLGTVDLQSYRQHAFNDDHVHLLQTLAANMGVAIENARLFEAEQQRNAELAIINSIQEGLATELDFQAIINLVGEKMREVFATPNLSINWYDEATNLVHYPYHYEFGEPIVVAAHEPNPGGLMETILKTRQPIVINNPADMGNLNAPTIPGTADPKSSIYVPIISSDRVLGIIGIDDFRHENAFGESEQRLLATITATLGTALENARLFDETQHLLKETEQRNAELAIINSVQAALAAELNIQGIYDAVGDKIREIFDNADVGIRIYDPETDLLHYPYTYEHGERLFLDSEPLGSGFTAYVLRTRETVVINENMEEEAEKYGSSLIPGRRD